ncbi:MAG: GGDEF domain-containing protein [Syntrophales bacterium LBB04]|nr:GGDEF domain-containing protein [Syntrophales bacterium LBB04]
MTGLYNRRGFITLAEQQMKQAERKKERLMLLFADLDDLKHINDNLGHKAGDEALVEAADIFKEVFRKMDIIARIGGDEFAVLALEASLEYADMIKKRLQDQLDIHNARENRKFTISLSIGVAYFDPEQHISLDGLMGRADSLMYAQKMNKRAQM